MKIVETEINDIKHESLNNTNEIIQEIIEYVQPIFEKEYITKLNQVKLLKKEIKDKQEQLIKNKNILESLLKKVSKKEQEKLLLNKMGKLIKTGLIKEGMRNEMAVMLKTFESLPEDKIKSYLNETIRILSQKFAKN